MINIQLQQRETITSVPFWHLSTGSRPRSHWHLWCIMMLHPHAPTCTGMHPHAPRGQLQPWGSGTTCCGKQVSGVTNMEARFQHWREKTSQNEKLARNLKLLSEHEADFLCVAETSFHSPPESRLIDSELLIWSVSTFVPSLLFCVLHSLPWNLWSDNSVERDVGALKHHSTSCLPFLPVNVPTSDPQNLHYDLWPPDHPSSRLRDSGFVHLIILFWDMSSSSSSSSLCHDSHTKWSVKEKQARKTFLYFMHSSAALFPSAIHNWYRKQKWITKTETHRWRRREQRVFYTGCAVQDVPPPADKQNLLLLPGKTFTKRSKQTSSTRESGRIKWHHFLIWHHSFLLCGKYCDLCCWQLLQSSESIYQCL